MISESLVKMNTVSPLETEPRGDWDPNHRGLIFFGEVLIE